MASKKKFIEYMFLFMEPVPWMDIYHFERDLAAFFHSKDVEAEIAAGIEGVIGRKIVVLTKKQQIMEPPKNPPGRPLSIKSKLESLSPKKKESAPARDFKKGKFLVRKGYLKREI